MPAWVGRERMESGERPSRSDALAEGGRQAGLSRTKKRKGAVSTGSVKHRGLQPSQPGRGTGASYGLGPGRRCVLGRG